MGERRQGQETAYNEANKDHSTVLREGSEAFENGVPYTSNPYDTDTRRPFAQMWAQGWLDARSLVVGVEHNPSGYQG
jgi:hypothetical protein